MWLVSTALAGNVFVSADEARGFQGAVLDARGERAWRKGHLPNSAPIDWLDLRDGRILDGELSADLAGVAAALAAAGVRQDTPVLVYGAAGKRWGEEGRIFWTLDYLGHDQVLVLDGGVDAWTRAGLPLHTSDTRPPAGDFRARARPERRTTTDELAASLATRTVWDTRSREEFEGATPYGESRGGHVPGAAHLHFRDLMGDDGTLKPSDELRALLSAAGITPDRPVTTLCTGGVRAGFAYAVLRDLGYTDVSNYDGSMWAWSARSELPLEEGP